MLVLGQSENSTQWISVVSRGRERHAAAHDLAKLTDGYLST